MHVYTGLLEHGNEFNYNNPTKPKLKDGSDYSRSLMTRNDPNAAGKMKLHICWQPALRLHYATPRPPSWRLDCKTTKANCLSPQAPRLGLCGCHDKCASMSQCVYSWSSTVPTVSITLEMRGHQVSQVTAAMPPRSLPMAPSVRPCGQTTSLGVSLS